MDITTMKKVFGPSPIELLPAAQLLVQRENRKKMLLAGAVVLVVATAFLTYWAIKKINENGEFNGSITSLNSHSLKYKILPGKSLKKDDDIQDVPFEEE
jgi:hypothetical protein